MDYVAAVGDFSPEMVKLVSYHLRVPATMMFMSSFGESFPYSFTELGGLRIIVGDDEFGAWVRERKEGLVG